MLTFPKARTCVLVAAALVMTGVSTGCNSSNRTSSLPQSSYLNGFDNFDTAGERAPSAKTLFRLAQMLKGQNKLAQAEAVLVSTINRYEKFSPAYSELASIQLRTSRLDDSIHTLEVGLTMQPNDPVLLNNLGLCMMLKQDYELAYEAYNTAWTISPKNARYAANTALALGMMGRMDESREIYQQIMPAGQVNKNITIITNALSADVRASVESANEQTLTEATSADAYSSSVKTAGAETNE